MDLPQTASAAARAHQNAAYILIAMTNATRASVFRTLALDFCPTVVVVRDGQDAVEHLDRAGPPRLLITDLSLPRVDGFGVLRHLRRAAPTSRAGAIVVSAHESFRQVAQQLTETLGISKVFPLDVDRPPLRRAIAAIVAEESIPAPVPAPRALTAAPPADEPLAADERIGRTLFDLTRLFQLPIAAASWQLRDDPRLAIYVSSLDPATSIDGSVVSELLAHAAAAGDDPLVVPNLENHPVFSQSSAGIALHGFVGVPIVSPASGAIGALGLFDVKPLTMAAADIDAFVAHARDLAGHLAPFVTPRQAERTVESVERDFKALEQLAATDPLTGLANRRGCEKSIAGEISRAERERKPLSCILLDIDRFKQVNDTLGHQAGDQVLRELSAMLRRAVRAYDVVARWGGEEFLLVLPGADLEAARLLAERIRLGVQKLPMSAFGNSVTISAGTAEFDSDYDFEATLRTADRRMYEAKSAGRNCVV